jgi:hypothetical protein
VLNTFDDKKENKENGHKRNIETESFEQAPSLHLHAIHSSTSTPILGE